MDLVSWLTGEKESGRHFPGPYGLQLYSLRHQLPGHVAYWLRRVKQIGYQEVETAGLDGLTVEQFRRAMPSGLRCAGMHNAFARYQHQMPQIIHEAKTLGASYVGCAELPQKGKYLTMADVRYAAAGFNHFAAVLARHGLGFAFHAEVNAFYPLHGKPGFDHLIALTHPNVLQEMDVFWVKRGGQDPVTYLNRYPTRFKMLHLKGMRKGTPVGNFNVGTSPQDCVPLGQGILRMRPILEAALRIGIKYYFVEDESREAPQGIVTSMHYLKTVRL